MMKSRKAPSRGSKPATKQVPKSSFNVSSSETKQKLYSASVSPSPIKHHFEGYRPLGEHASKNGTCIGYKLSPSYEAPSAVQYTGTSRHMKMEGDLFSSVRIHMRVPIAYIQNTTIGTYPSLSTPALAALCSFNGSSASSSEFASMAFSPFRYPVQRYNSSGDGKFDLGVAFPPNLTLTSLTYAFTRWRLISDLRLEYEPGLNTNSSPQFRINWSQDPANPTFGFSSASNRVVQLTDIDDTPNTAAFAGWSPMCMDCPTNREWRYMYESPAYFTDTTSGGYIAPEIRMITAGMISCIASRVDTAATYITGFLFGEFTVEFADPLANSQNNLQGGLHHPLIGGLLKASSPEEVHQPPDDDDDEKGIIVPNSSFRIGPPPIVSGVPISSTHTLTTTPVAAVATAAPTHPYGVGLRR